MMYVSTEAALRLSLTVVHNGKRATIVSKLNAEKCAFQLPLATVLLPAEAVRTPAVSPRRAYSIHGLSVGGWR